MRSWLIPILAVLTGLAGCGRSPAPAQDSGAGLASVPAGLATAALAPPQLGLCASCHGREGISVIPGTPNLAGRDRAELLAAMQAYLDGGRDYPPMRAMLGPIRPADRQRLADWYAGQPAPTADAAAADDATAAPGLLDPAAGPMAPAGDPAAAPTRQAPHG